MTGDAAGTDGTRPPPGLKRTGGFILAALILALAGLLASLSLRRYAEDAEWVSHTHEVIGQAQILLTHAVDSQTGERGYVLTGDEGFLAPFRRARERIGASLEELGRLSSDNPAQRSRMTAIRDLVSQRMAFEEGVIETRRNRGFEAAQATVARGEGESVMDLLRSNVAEFTRLEHALLAERAQRLETSGRRTLGAVIGLGTAGFAILAVTALRIRRDFESRAVVQAAVERMNEELAARARELAEEVAVRQAAEEAVKSRNEELKSFAYTVSHDLKAPLRGITGYAQELERRHSESLSERARFCVTQIITAGRNLDALIDDLLRYARLDAEGRRFAPVNLQTLIAGIVEDRGRTARDLGAVIEIDVPQVTVTTWERGLQQALSNVVDNALKYSRRATPPRITIRARDLGKILRIEVEDNGIGFDMKYHDRIFGLFNRLVRADEFEGTGAGLAIVRKALERMDGTIHAKSSPGEGTTFIIEIRKTEEQTR